jgi:hypothetical protein
MGKGGPRKVVGRSGEDLEKCWNRFYLKISRPFSDSRPIHLLTTSLHPMSVIASHFYVFRPAGEKIPIKREKTLDSKRVLNNGGKPMSKLLTTT